MTRNTLGARRASAGVCAMLWMLVHGCESISKERGALRSDSSLDAAQAPVPAPAPKHVMLMNRIGPSASELYIANPDGGDAHKLFESDGFDYHATYSYDGEWIVFTSERGGYGHADIYRAHPDGSGIEQLTDSPAFDDQGVLSPDGSRLAFVSTRDTYRANIWILDLDSRELHNLTGRPDIQGDIAKPDGFFKPAWSPDGEWIAFSSDRNT